MPYATGIRRIHRIVPAPLVALLILAPSAALPSAAPPTWGDVSGDGAITAIDGQAILNSVVGLPVPTTYTMLMGDANCDGTVGAVDALIVFSKVVGLNVSQFCVATAAKPTVSGDVRDVVDFNPVVGAIVTLAPLSQSQTQSANGFGVVVSPGPKVATTDSAGHYVFYNNVPDGSYTLSVAGSSFQQSATSTLTMAASAPVKADVALTLATSHGTFASLSGRVLSSTGVAVAGAAVAISGGSQTNGVFKATTTSADGTYSFAGINLNDASIPSSPIQSFTVSGRSAAGEAGSTAALTLVANEIRANVDVNLLAPGTVTNYFSDGFETGITAWTKTSGWNLRGTAPIVNQAYPIYVKLAPNDGSAGAVPLPATGSGAAWIGFPASGNFMGQQLSTDTPLSGGTSASIYSELLTSPSFAIPASALRATLAFDTWFEIESVSPNLNGNDIMEVLVTDVSANVTSSLVRLNPFEDPSAPNRNAIPFTSGGFNRAPVWRPVFVGLDAYRGKTVKLGFCFRTVDQLHNGFRGWLIDNVRVGTEAMSASASSGANPSSGSPGATPHSDPSSTVQAGVVTSCGGNVSTPAVATLAVTPTPITVFSFGPNTQLVATAKDASGNLLLGRSVTWTSSNPAFASVSSTGLLQANNPGAATITATAETKVGTAVVTVSPYLTAMSANGVITALVPKGTAVPVPPSVKVITRATQAGAAGVAVKFAVATGGGSITGASQTTDGNGIATVGSWTLGPVAGDNTLIATASAAVTGSPVTFTASGAEYRYYLRLVAGDNQGAPPGGAVQIAPSVRVTNLANVGVAGVTVTFAVASGGGSLTGATQTTDTSGLATVGSWTLGPAAGRQTISATVTGAIDLPIAATATTSDVLNLTIAAVVVDQASQTFTNTVPLIAGRPALLQVYPLASKANTVRPSVRVRLYRGTTLVNTFILGARPTSVPTTAFETFLENTWYAIIPGSAIQPGISLLADVDPTNSIFEFSKADNTFPLSGTPMPLDVRTPATVNVTLIPVLQVPNGRQGDITEANKATYMEFAYRVFPITAYNAVVHAPSSYSSEVSTTYDNTWSTLLSEINALRVAEGSIRNYYGIIKPVGQEGGTGMGYTPGLTAIGADFQQEVFESHTAVRAATPAHEWAHNFGRLHVNCGNPSDVDPNYPYSGETIGPRGFDVTLNNTINPIFARDLMSYCTPVWISDYTYKGILDARATLATPSTSPAPQHGLLVWGRIGPDGVVLEPSFEVDAPPSLPAHAGPYRLRATDDGGRELFNLSFEGEAIDHLPNVRHFAFVIPLATTARPSELRLLANNRESIRRNILPSAAAGSVAAPTTSLSLTSSVGQRSKLQWDAAIYPMAMVRDPATGQILAFARGGQVDIRVPGQSLDVIFSNGVTSVRRLVPITPK